MIRRLRSLAHGLADDVVTGLFTRPKLYADGFGDLDRLERLVERVRDYDAATAAPEISPRWEGPARIDPRIGCRVRRGSFESPVASLLPAESRRARVHMCTPLAATADERPPVCLLLAATGEQGHGSRRALTRRLASRGIATLSLENPFYGKRRPRAQFMAVLRTVEDQFAMNCATVEEARALLAWLRDEGHARIGVSGYSQGGMMAAFAAALSDFDLAAVPRAAGSSAAPIFTEAALMRRFDWDRLAAPFGSVERAREHFARCLEPVDARRFPPPRSAGLAVIVASSHDRFVPRRESESLHAHWPGSELRLIDAGHLTGALRTSAHVQAICDAFARFAAKTDDDELA